VALDRVRPDLEEAMLGKKTYWSFADPGPEIPAPPPALLLPIYDEYAIAYRDRGDISDKREIERMIARGNALTGIIVLQGRVSGSWSKALRHGSVGIRLKPFRPLDDEEKEAVEQEVGRYGEFFGIPAVVAGDE
jgi:hypothetical protein